MVNIQDPLSLIADGDIRSQVDQALSKLYAPESVDVIEVDVNDLIAEKRSKESSLQDLILPSEAVYGFAGWLISQKDKVVFSSRNDAAPVIAALEKFLEYNNWRSPADGWEKMIVFPHIADELQEKQKKATARLFIKSPGLTGGTQTEFEEKPKFEQLEIEECANNSLELGGVQEFKAQNSNSAGSNLE